MSSVLSLISLVLAVLHSYPGGGKRLGWRVVRLILALLLLWGGTNLAQWRAAIVSGHELPTAIRVAVRVLGKSPILLSLRGHLAVAILEQEEMELMWVEAASGVSAEMMQMEVAALQAELAKPGTTPAAGSSPLVQRRQALGGVEQQLKLAVATATMYADAQRQAQQMRQAAAQSRAILAAQLELLAATGLMRTEGAMSSSWAQTVGLDLAAFQAELERTLAIAAARTQLEQALRASPFPQP